MSDFGTRFKEILDAHSAPKASWRQCDAEELMVLLKNMPTQVRNRLLSSMRMSTAGTTLAASRLMIQGAVKLRPAEMLRSGRNLTFPIAAQASNVVTDAASKGTRGLVGALDLAVGEMAEDFGTTLVVLSAVTHAYVDPTTSVPLMLACQRAGMIDATLRDAVEEISSVYEDHVDEVLESLGYEASEDDEPRSDDDGVDVEEDGYVAPDDVEALWEEAKDASRSISRKISDGAVPSADSRKILDLFARSLERAAADLGVTATVRAVTDALEIDEDAESVLVHLTGPAAFFDAIEEVRTAAAEAGTDPDRDERLEIFAELIAAEDPIRRISLAGALRGLPAPPAPELIDAALASMLAIGDDDTAGGSEVVVEPAVSEVDDESDSASISEPAAGAVAVDSEASDVLAEVIEDHVAELDARGAIDADQPDGANLADQESDEETPAVAPSEESVKDLGRDVELSDDGADELDGVSQPEGLGDETLVEQPVDPDLETRGTAKLWELTATSRFGLAHHLALALGDDYHAAILGEAAYAAAVRSVRSACSEALVEDVGATLLNTTDPGSVVLRAATLIRVALLDPDSGAGDLLRTMLGAIDELGVTPALAKLATCVVGVAQIRQVVAADGPSANGDGEQREALVSFTQETLESPPRFRFVRAGEIWKDWVGEKGALGQALAVVASDDGSRAGAVRESCREFATRNDVASMIKDADRAKRRGAPAAPKPMTGMALEDLTRRVTDLVASMLDWCDIASANTSTHDSGPLEQLRDLVHTQRAEIMVELDALGSAGGWTEAAATAVAASLDGSMGLVEGHPLDDQELAPSEALNRGLTLVQDLELGPDLSPIATPRLDALVAAADRSRGDALALRLSAHDFGAGEALLDLNVGDGVTFDDDKARRELLSQEREVRATVVEHFDESTRRLYTARARGWIDDAVAAELVGRLDDADPTLDRGRRDLGAVRRELELIAQRLEEASTERAAQVNQDISDARNDGLLSPEWNDLLRKRMRNGEIGAAEEYLYRAKNGENAPVGDADDVDAVFDLADAIDQVAGGLDATLLDAVTSGSATGPLDVTAVPEANRDQVVEGLEAWIALHGEERPANLVTAVTPVLRLLGLVPQDFDRKKEHVELSSRDRWVFDVRGSTVGKAYVPEFGSRSNGLRRVLLCFEELTADQLWSVAAEVGGPGQPAYVLYLGAMSSAMRTALANRARTEHGSRVAVIDDAVIAACAAEGSMEWGVTMRAILPYTAANPYDPDVQVTAEEMFFGRRAERDSVASPSGSAFISGGRRFGKSAILQSAKERATAASITAVLIQIQHVASTSPFEPAELWTRVGPRLIEAGVLGPGTPSEAAEVTAGIRAWLAEDAERSLLLMLDECDFFLKADADRRFRNVAELRDLMYGSQGRFKVVFSGLQHVARYKNLPNQPLSHLPQPLVIGPLDPSSATSLIRRPLRALGFDITEDQIDRLVTYCACNPSVIQLACRRLVEQLRGSHADEPAPWSIDDEDLDQLLDSTELRGDVRRRLFFTLDLDNRYKMLAYLIAHFALEQGMGSAITLPELRRLAAPSWPEAFGDATIDDIRALADELVGLGVLSGDEAHGYRMLSPATVSLFGTEEEIIEEINNAAETYQPDISDGAGAVRIALGEGGRFSPLSSEQLFDAVGYGKVQLRVIAGSRALLSDLVAPALENAAKSVGADLDVAASRREFADAMPVGETGHRVVLGDLRGVGIESFDASVAAALTRGKARTAKGTRSAVLVVGPGDRPALTRLLGDEDLGGRVVSLQRITAAGLRAWVRLEELSIALPLQQQRLLEVTGGWPELVDRITRELDAGVPFDTSVATLAEELATPEGARALVAGVGLDPEAPDQPGDPGVQATFAALVELEEPGDIETLAEILSDMGVEDDDPAAAIGILELLGALERNGDGELTVEPVLVRCWAAAGIVSPALT